MLLTQTLLTLLLVVPMYAVFAKMAARMYRKSVLSWRTAFGFGVMVAPLAVVGAALRGTLPIIVVVAIFLSVAVPAGGSFLATRATDAEGQPLGFKSAAVLTTLAIGIGFSLSVLLTMVLPTVQR